VVGRVAVRFFRLLSRIRQLLHSGYGHRAQEELDTEEDVVRTAQRRGLLYRSDDDPRVDAAASYRRTLGATGMLRVCLRTPFVKVPQSQRPLMEFAPRSTYHLI
jgi:hypothetical protein